MTEDELNRKCKDTKRLVRIAIEHGMTQSEIAKKARLSGKSGSLVSRWRSRPALATNRQMTYLIKEYGDLLKRKSEHLFYSGNNNDMKFYKLKGELILKYSVRTIETINRRPVKVALMRVIVIKQHNTFHLVLQMRYGIQPPFCFSPSSFNQLSHSDNEEANWATDSISMNLSPTNLVLEVDEYALSLLSSSNLLKEDFPLSARELRFILRQALLKQGYESDDIIDLASEK